MSRDLRAKLKEKIKEYLALNGEVPLKELGFDGETISLHKKNRGRPLKEHEFEGEVARLQRELLDIAVDHDDDDDDEPKSDILRELMNEKDWED